MDVVDGVRVVVVVGSAAGGVHALENVHLNG